MYFDSPEGNEGFVTSDVNVLTKGSSHNMSQCDYKEADIRFLLHLVDALKNGCSTCVVRTVYRHCMMLLLSSLARFITSINPSVRIWVAFGAAKAFSYLHINSICHSRGEKGLWLCLCSSAFEVVIRHQDLWQREKVVMGSVEVLP